MISHNLPWEKALKISQDSCDTYEREVADEQQVKQETFRMDGFTCSGGKTLRSMGLLHILIYFGSHPFLPSVAFSRESLRQVLTAEGAYLSLNGNRIPTCYFLWEGFLGCCSPHALEFVRETA